METTNNMEAYVQKVRETKREQANKANRQSSILLPPSREESVADQLMQRFVFKHIILHKFCVCLSLLFVSAFQLGRFSNKW